MVTYATEFPEPEFSVAGVHLFYTRTLTFTCQEARTGLSIHRYQLFKVVNMHSFCLFTLYSAEHFAYKTTTSTAITVFRTI